MASPKVTLALVCYAQEDFIENAVKAALAQDYEPLEIVISDDASPDSTFDIVESTVAKYNGPHVVRLNRNPANLGSLEHHQQVVSMARGDFVVFAHGDDISLPHRTRRLVDAWRERDVSLVSSNAVIVNAEGKPIGVARNAGADEEITAEQIVEQGWHPYMVGATLACHRNLFTKFSWIDPKDAVVGFDHIFPFRAALLNGMCYLSEPLVHWRKHDTNLTNVIFDRTGDDLRFRETRDAFSATVRMCMLDDLSRLMKERPDDPHLRALAGKLRRRILQTVRRWTRHRNELMHEGLRPTWIEKETLEAKPIARDWDIRSAPSKKGSVEGSSKKS